MRRMTNPCARLGCLHRPEDKAAVFVKFSSALQDASKQARRQKTRRIHPRCTRRHAYTDPLVDHGPAAAIAARTSAVLTPKQHSRCTPNRRETAPQRRRRDSSKKKMFKKFDQSAVSSRSQVKSSVVRGIRAALIEQYPLIEDVIDDILPKKDISMAKCQNHVNILCAAQEPLFFQQRDGPWYPTLRLVHRRKSCFATSTWQTDAGAIRFVLGGANIMCPGFTSEDGALDHDLPKGSPVVIGAHGKKHAMAVGQVLMGRDDVREVNKGHCVENLHFLGDGLWQAEKLD